MRPTPAPPSFLHSTLELSQSEDERAASTSQAQPDGSLSATAAARPQVCHAHVPGPGRVLPLLCGAWAAVRPPCICWSHRTAAKFKLPCVTASMSCIVYPDSRHWKTSILRHNFDYQPRCRERCTSPAPLQCHTPSPQLDSLPRSTIYQIRKTGYVGRRHIIRLTVLVGSWTGSHDSRQSVMLFCIPLAWHCKAPRFSHGVCLVSAKTRNLPR